MKILLFVLTFLDLYLESSPEAKKLSKTDENPKGNSIFSAEYFRKLCASAQNNRLITPLEEIFTWVDSNQDGLIALEEYKSKKNAAPFLTEASFVGVSGLTQPEMAQKFADYIHNCAGGKTFTRASHRRKFLSEHGICLKPLFRLGLRCVECDKINQYADELNGVCVECDKRCVKCSPDGECLKCSYDSFNIDGTCRPEPCHPLCKECVNNTCTSCQDSTNNDKIHLVNGRCSKCSRGNEFYDSKLERCLVCDAFCARCYGPEMCEICDTNTIWTDGKCKSTPCTNNCEKCQSGLCLQCKTGTYLSRRSNICTNCPVVGYYWNEYEESCQKCPIRCNSCTNSYSCERCIDGYYAFEGRCVLCNKNGQYASKKDGKCHTCPSNCRNCDEFGQCTRCDFKFYKDSFGDCVTCNLPNQEKIKDQSGIDSCVECTGSCETCRPKRGCITCKPGFYLKGSSCVSGCGNHEYISFESNFPTCKVCPSECKLCETDGKCKICADPNKNVDIHGKCITCEGKGIILKRRQLPDFEQAGHPELMICLKCPVHCSDCDPQGNCLICKEGFYLFEGACTLCDTPNLVIEKSAKLCKECVPNCEVCKSEYSCRKCIDGLFLTEDGAGCIPCDKDGQFVYETSPGRFICTLCAKDCMVCSNENKCKICKNGLLVTPEGTCVTCENSWQSKSLLPSSKIAMCLDICNHGEYHVGQACFRCGLSCLSCLDNSTCIQCHDNYYISSFGICTPCQGPGEISTGPLDGTGHCKICQRNCAKCLGERSCLDCDEGYYLKGALCTLCDKSGELRIEATINTVARCGTCPPNCETCQSSDTCTICNLGFYLINNNCITCTNKGEYKDEETRTCYLCDPRRCDVCENKSACKLCLPGFYLSAAKCITCNEKGQYKLEKFNGKPATCIDCSANCEECLDSLTCKTCFNDFYLLDGKCVPCVQIGKFRNRQSLRCEACSTNCEICEDGETCKKCSVNYYLKSHTCLLCDEIGYLKVGSSDGSGICNDFCRKNEVVLVDTDKERICIVCSDNCLKCATDDNCALCEPNTFRLNNRCVFCNKPSEFPENDISGNGLCHICDKNCDKCLNKEICEKCLTGYSLRDGKCFPCDKSGEVSILNKAGISECKRCIFSCSVCYDLNTCEICQQDYYLYNRACIKCDEPGQYRSTDITQRSICTNCVPNCRVCETESSCNHCSQDYFLLDGHCIECQVKGHYKLIDPINGNKCVFCQTNCLTCLDESNCRICSNSYVVRNGKCVRCDEPGHIMAVDDFDGNPKCFKCSEHCKLCADRFNCAKCYDGFYLLNGDCVTCKERDQETNVLPDGTWICKDFCKDGEYYDVVKKTCSQCVKNCKICTNENKCRVCLHKHYFLNGECVRCNEPGQFKDTDESGIGHCSYCSSNCENCLSQNKCRYCKDLFFLEDGSCVDCQNNGKLKSFIVDDLGERTAVCLRCSSNCLKCSSINVCYLCEPDFFLKNNQCVPCNKPGEYADRLENRCFDCNPPSCNKCLNSTSCEVCHPDFHLFMDTTCVTCDKPGQFIYELSKANVKQNQMSLCLKCFDNCAKCTESTSCLLCNEGFFLRENNCIKCDQPSDFRGLNGVCYDCGDNCNFCENEKMCKHCLSPFYNLRGSCDLCVESSFRKIITLEGNICSSNCQVSEFLFNGECVSCVENCEICLNQTVCKKCSQGFFLNIDGSCEPCIENNKLRFKGFYCLSCPKNCAKCGADDLLNTYCIECDKPFLLNSNYMCTEVCALTEIRMNNKCFECLIPHCLHCATLTDKCSLCESGFYLKEGKCTECDLAGDLKKSNGICSSCPEGCVLCSSEKSCNVCNDNLVLSYSGLCLQTCVEPEKLYTDLMGRKICRVCDKNCEDCPEASDICSKCKVGFYRDNKNLCVPCLNPGEFPDGDKCAICSNNCINCENAFSCKSCSQDSVILFGRCSKCLNKEGNHCNEVCKQGTHLNIHNLLCEPCKENCERCHMSDNGLLICDLCHPNYFLYRGECISCVGQGLIASGPQSGEGYCIVCQDDCEICFDNVRCAKCLPGFFLTNDRRCDLCDSPQVYKSTSPTGLSMCLSCGPYCDSCLDQDNCKKCSQGFYLDGKNTCSKCQAIGVYITPDLKSCRKCAPYCVSCHNENQCLQCERTFYLLNEKECVKCLEKGQQQMTLLNPDNQVNIKRCIECPKNCKSCISNGALCITCEPGFVQRDGQCVLCNKAGEFLYTLDSGLVSCIKCAENCIDCLNAFSCLKCQDEYSLNEKGSCISNKTKLSKVENSDSVCNISQCLRCTSPEKCDLCEPGLYLLRGQCSLCLGQGEISSTDISGLGSCHVCAANCQSCLDFKTCKRCSPGYYLKGGACSSCDAHGQFRNENLGLCHECSQNCEMCKNPNECKRCLPGFGLMLSNRQCVLCRSFEGYFDAEFGLCGSCPVNCAKCNTTLTCDFCVEGYYLHEGSCIRTCPPTLWSQTQGIKLCLSCSENCNRCKSRSECKKCEPGFFLQDSKCVPCLKMGFFKEGLSDGLGYCKKCRENCEFCQDSGSCEVCAPNFFLDSEQMCKPCSTSCEKCIDQDVCEKCQEGFFLKGLNECIKCNQPGEYKNMTTITCKQCVDHCFDCQDENLCKRCQPNYYNNQGFCILCSEKHMQKFGEGDGTGMCVEKDCLQPGTFMSPRTGTCEPCDADCLICQTETSCKLCIRGFYKLNGKCTKCDKLNQIRPLTNYGVCMECTTNCLECENLYQCKVCSPPYLLNPKNRRCETCEDISDIRISFNKSSIEVCKRCQIPNCEICETETVCSVCKLGFFIGQDGLNCTSCNQPGLVANKVTRQCLSCSSDCMICDQNLTCIVCQQGFYSLNGICIGFCNTEKGYYIDGFSSCRACGNNCERCINNQVCTKCEHPYVQKDNKCVLCIDAGSALDNIDQTKEPRCGLCSPNGSCKKCLNATHCELCTGNLSNILGSCYDCNQIKGFKQFIDDQTKATSCQSPCDFGSFFIKNSCEKCQKDCEICETESSCIKCKPGYYLDINKACLICKNPGVYRSPDNSGNGYCGICPSNCAECQDQNTCIECRDNYFLNKNLATCENCIGDGQYIDFSTKECLNCSLNCKSCSDFFLCRICKRGYYLKNGFCDICDQPGEYRTKDGSCGKCIEGCEICNNDILCQRCSMLFLLKERECVPCEEPNQYREIDEIGRRICVNCAENCLKCRSDQSCEVCAENFFNYQGTCSLCESSGLVKEILITGEKNCILCAENCEKCKNKFTCDICTPKYYLSDLTGHCTLCNELNEVKTGPEDGTGKCHASFVKLVAIQKCSAQNDCNMCETKNDCLLCNPGFYYFNNTCDPCDSPGMYREPFEISGRGICYLCGEGCEVCGGKKTCKICKKGWYLLGTQCVACNKDSQFSTIDFNGNNKCVSCNQKGCKKCSHPLRCDVCFSGLFVNKEGECQECLDPHCDTCSEPSKCDSCIRGWYILNSSCITCEEPGQFRGRDGLCYKCPEHCKTCFNENECNECESNHFRDSKGQCRLCNQEGDLRSHDGSGIGICEPCNKNCAFCLNPRNCSQCLEGYFLSNGTCSQCEAPGTFKLNNTCVQCGSNCKLCLNEVDCEECMPNYFKLEGKCSLCMDTGLFRDDTDMSCITCQENCDVCRDRTSCKTCAPSFYLFNQTYCTHCNNSGYLKLEETKECVECPANCLKCESDKICLECLPNYFFYKNTNNYLNCIDCKALGPRGSVNLATKNCQLCPDKYFYLSEVSGINYCRRCAENCQACENAEGCIECEEGFFRLGEICSLCTLPGYFRTANEKGHPVCTECSENCLVCKSENQCATCKEGFHLNSLSNCVSCDGPGNIITKNFLGNTECIMCKPGCEICHDTFRCKVCSQGLFLRGNECVPCNAPGEYRLKREELVSGYTVAECHYCSRQCIRCSDSRNCMACSENFVLRGGNCVPCNNPGEIKTIDPQGKEACSICQPKCKRCASKVNCRECIEGYYLRIGKCIECRDPGMVRMKDNMGVMICGSCQENCRKCDSSLTCQLCEEGFYALNGGCVTCTDPGQIKIRTNIGEEICVVCSDNCKYCLNKNECARCFDDYFLSKGKCVICDKPWEIKKHIEKTCDECTPNCQSCKSENSCMICEVGYYLNSGRCFRCQPNDFLIHITCLNCNIPGCSICKTKNTCSRCLNDYFLFDDGRGCVSCTEMGQFAIIDPMKNLPSKCVFCQDFCAKCRSSSECELCSEGFYRIDGKCIICNGPYESKIGEPDGTGICQIKEFKAQVIYPDIHPAIYAQAYYQSESQSNGEITSASTVKSNRKERISNLAQSREDESQANVNVNVNVNYLGATPAGETKSWSDVDIVNLDAFYSGYQVNFIHRKGTLSQAKMSHDDF